MKFVSTLTLLLGLSTVAVGGEIMNGWNLVSLAPEDKGVLAILFKPNDIIQDNEYKKTWLRFEHYSEARTTKVELILVKVNCAKKTLAMGTKITKDGQDKKVLKSEDLGLKTIETPPDSLARTIITSVCTGKYFEET